MRCRSPVAALVVLLVVGIGYSLVEVGRHHAAAATARTTRVRARAFAVVESSYWLTTGVGRDAGAARRSRVAGPRGALAIVGAALPLLVVSALGAG